MPSPKKHSFANRKSQSAWIKKQKRKPKSFKKSKTTHWVGVLIKQHNKYFVQTEKSQLNIIPKNLGEAKIGSKVVVTQNKYREYEITSKVIASSFQEITEEFEKNQIHFKPNFSQEILQEISSFKEPTHKLFPLRKNLTQEYIIAIDPPSARDHDDAISFQKSKNGWELQVHIADVAEYVKDHSSLDLEAQKRSFTRYLPWKAIGMLPQELANHLCSLKENHDRLALTCSIKLDIDGRLLSYDFFESIVCVKKFYSYNEAWKKFQKQDPYFKDLNTLANLLKNQRKNSLEFQLPETNIMFNEQKNPIQVQPTDRVPSYQWIEDFMLICNQCCADFLHQKNLKGMYRIHENPDLENILSLAHLPNLITNSKDWQKQIKNIKTTRKINLQYQKKYSQLLNNLQQKEQTPQLKNLQTQILQTMKKAIYSPHNKGHFALGFKNYAHFTSPIRRYPDLWNHRFMKQYLKTEKTKKVSEQELENLTTAISNYEIDCTKLERSSYKVALAWILKDDLGEIFEATITDINEKGMAFYFKHPKACGEEWLPVFSLTDDYYLYIVNRKILKGKRTQKIYRVGQNIKVILESVDPLFPLLRFSIINS